ncbi:MAG: hypothetical protein GY810_28605 [Aureispira sp.]|nr:hypothetical protein [Aureispira sp.]
MKNIIKLLLLYCLSWQSIAAQQIIKAEYFFDTDPRVQNGTTININSPANSINLLDSINVSGLDKGYHRFCIRYMNDSSQWSHTECYTIQVSQPQLTPQIVGGEHFVNSDPGIGNAIPFTVNTPLDPLSILDSLDIDTLSKGVHRFCIRYRNNMDQWSHTECYTIQVAQPEIPAKIIAGEYFFDADPGIGLAISLGTFSPADTLLMTDSIDMTGVSTGLHVFGVRYRNNMGQWTHTARYLVQVTKAKKLTMLEYVVDGTPGVQAGTMKNITPPTEHIIDNDSLNTAALAVGSHTLSVWVKDALGNWSEHVTDTFYVCNGVGAVANITVDSSSICQGTPVTFNVL